MEDEKQSRRDAVSEQPCFIMEMGPRRSSGASHRPDRPERSEKNETPLLHGDLAQVGVAGLKPEKMSDPYEIAV